MVRHGETNFHVEGRYQGISVESRLTERGQDQAVELSTCLNQLDIEQCYSSPLTRAIETLEILKPAIEKAEVTIDCDLSEVGISEWEGKKKSLIADEALNSILLWRCLPHIFHDHNGSRPLEALYARVRSFVERATAQAGTKLVVGHDHVNRAIISTLLDLRIEEHPLLPQAVSSISIVSPQMDSDALALHVSNFEHVNEMCKPIELYNGPRIIFIRHGVTDANVNRVYQGTDDLPLNTQGRRQAAELSGMLRFVRPHIIISSELARARQTAESLPFARSKVSRTVDRRLNEFFYGRWQGLSDADVQARFPEDIAAWRLMIAERPISGGESLASLVGRVTACLIELWELARRHGTIIVVAHDIVLRTAIMQSLNLSLRHLWKFPISNCGISELRINQIGNVVLTKHNLIAGPLEGFHEYRYL